MKCFKNTMSKRQKTTINLKATNQFVYSAIYSVWFKNLSRTKRRLMIYIRRQIIFIIVKCGLLH